MKYPKLRLRTVVVGLGRIGWQYHLPAVHRHPGFVLAAAVDPLPDRRAEAESVYGARTYADLASALAAERPDLVVVASPTRLHPAHAIESLEAGADVFLDKPIAASLAEADRILEAVARTGGRLMLYQPYRLRPETQAVRAILDGGSIGTPFLIRFAQLDFVRRNDWQSLRAEGGGILNNYGAHFVDLLLHLARAPVRSLSCAVRRIVSVGDAEDTVSLRMETDSNLLLGLDLSWAAAVPLPRWSILGDRGGASWEQPEGSPGEFRIRTFRTEDLAALPLHPELAAPGRSYRNEETIPWREERLSVDRYSEDDYYDHCHRYFSGEGGPLVPLAETREVARVLEECRAQAQESFIGPLPPPRGSHARRPRRTPSRGAGSATP